MVAAILKTVKIQDTTYPDLTCMLSTVFFLS